MNQRARAALAFSAALVCFGAASRMQAAESTGDGAGRDSAREIVVSTAEGYINVRKTPSEEGDVLGKLYPGGIGTVMKSGEADGWVKIRSGRVRGYVSEDLVAVGDEAGSLMSQAGYLEAQVLPGGATVYYEADDTTEMVAAEGESTFLTVLEEGEDWIKVRTPYGVEGWTKKEEVRISTAYSTAETLAAEEERMEQIREADETAAAESALWEEAQEALLATSETKAALLEVQMELEAVQDSFREAGGGKEATEALKEAIEKEAAAQSAADEDQKAAEEKVAKAQKASEAAQAAEKVAVEAARRAPRGAQGADFVTARDHSIYIETSVGQELVNYACQFVGNPYVWGGESLTDGCDCSGFTMLVYARYGITLPHFAQSQAMYGELVSEEELEPGDLVFFQNGTGYIHHVAIYIGNHTIVHAANSVSGICFSNIHYSSDRIICRHLLG